MEKQKVYVLMGGNSPLFDVSLKSGEHVLSELDPSRYDARAVVIGRDGAWEAAPGFLSQNPGTAFLALHGEGGEDGSLQSLLDSHGIPYTGSSAAASALAMNKFVSLQLLADTGVRVPQTLHLHRKEWAADASLVRKTAKTRIGYPAIVKSNRGGGSIGVSLVKDEKELDEALSSLFHATSEVLVQEYIRGREFSCGVLDHGWNESAFALHPAEIVTRSGVQGYAEKHSPQGSLKVIPPENVSEQKIKEMQNIALHAHRKLGAAGVSETNIIMDKSGALYAIEANTCPYFHPDSAFIRSAEHSGWSAGKLFQLILDSSARARELSKSRHFRLISA